MKHMIYRYLRKPVAVIKLSAIIDGAYDGMMVVCDDGATFSSFPDGDGPRIWTEGSPIPGSVRAMNLGYDIPIREAQPFHLMEPKLQELLRKASHKQARTGARVKKAKPRKRR